MSWVTIIWSMAASASLTLAALNLLVWWKQRTAWAHLLFSLTALGTVAFAYFELSMMRAQTPAEFAAALRQTTIRMGRHERKLLGSLAAMVFAALASCARADQGGVAFWWSGQFASLAAVPSAPGWSLVTSPYYYSGSADKSKTFQRGDRLVAEVNSSVPMLMFQPGYAADTKFLGGQPYVGLGWGPAYNRTSVDIALSQPELQRNGTDSITGGTDLYPYASLAWASGNDNWMAYLTGDIPVGAYNANRLANIGIGHSAIDAGGGYTYLNGKSGLEFSAVAGVTYNWENTHTNYKNGVDSHLDWAVSQFLNDNWEVGVAGYVYYQLTGDSGSGDKVGAFKSRIASVGPEVGYAFKFNDQPAYFNLRGYWEFWAQNRVEGYAIFGTLGIPLGGARK